LYPSFEFNHIYFSPHPFVITIHLHQKSKNKQKDWLLCVRSWWKTMWANN